MKDKIKKQVIKDYKNTFGIPDVPTKNLGKDDLMLIEWATSLVKNLALFDVIPSFYCYNDCSGQKRCKSICDSCKDVERLTK
jgi:hypothetical protein